MTTLETILSITTLVATVGAVVFAIKLRRIRPTLDRAREAVTQALFERDINRRKWLDARSRYLDALDELAEYKNGAGDAA